MPGVDLEAALADGPLTMDGLHEQLGRPERDALRWALDEAVAFGTVVQSGGACDDRGICASGAPALFALPKRPRD
ncbi:MAG: hypothetical protein JWO90_2305 [Solirubrobacterales bacterium]|jgi:hypothetical protein|nr:hypothetical protein [Solirubrobacterales bacterium]